MQGRGDHEMPGVVALDAEAVSGVIVAGVIGRVSLGGVDHGDGVSAGRRVRPPCAGVGEQVGLSVGESGDATKLKVGGGLQVDAQLTAKDGVAVDGHQIGKGEGFGASSFDGVGQVIDGGISSAGVGGLADDPGTGDVVAV